MSSHLNKKQSKSNFDDQYPESDDDDKSVEDMLANVDQFIESVYRDLSMTPPRRPSMADSTNLGRSFNTSISPPTTSPAGPATLPIATSGSESSSPSTTSDGPDTFPFITPIREPGSPSPTSQDGLDTLSIATPIREPSSQSTTSNGSDTLPITTPRRQDTPTRSPFVRRNMNAEIERINQICDNVDQNLRSIGLFMNGSSPNSLAESLSNTNLTNTPSSSTSIIIVNNTSPSFSPMTRRTRRRKRSSVDAAVESFIDLSNSQADTPEIYTRSDNHRNANNDDDIILVSANIPQVVDLCTPGSHQEVYRTRNGTNYVNLNRRRLHRDSIVSNDEDSICEEVPSSSRRRRTASSLNETQSSSTDHEGRPPFMCPVCMESCLQRQPTSTLCGHIFCKLCLERAITLTHKCPMCNKRLTKKQTLRIYL